MIADVTGLFLIGVASLGLLVLIGGESSHGLEPYYRDVARNCFSITALVKYLAVVATYAICLEIALRLLQDFIQKRWGAMAGVLIAALAYGLTHFKFHLSGAIYAATLGLGTAWFFHRTGRWKSLVVWHVWWELAAIGFVIGNTMFVDSHCRHVTMIEYKSSQIAEGKVFFVDEWGWADQGHCAFEEIETLRQTLWKNRGKTVQFTRTHVATDVWHRSKNIDYNYRIDPPLIANKSECHAAAAMVLWDAAKRHEIHQGQQSFLAGTRMSAFAVEDMPSVLLSAYMLQPDEHSPITLRKHDSQLDFQRWHTEGPALIKQKIVDLSDFRAASETVHRDLERLVDRMKQTEPWYQPIPFDSP